MICNIGVNYGSQLTCPFDVSTADINVDLMRLPHVNVIADVQHMPFANRSFDEVYCFHVLEHVENPALALKELVRVASQLVELEVPFWLGKNARGRLTRCSFRPRWFHAALKHTAHCIRMLWGFPLNLDIHVWIYPKVKRLPLPKGEYAYRPYQRAEKN
jgi:SAM-dependent methyltransferase